jgi:hypothetical protein
MSEKWIGSPISKVDESIDIIEFEIRRKLKAIKHTETKLELTEGEKIKIGKEYDFIRNIRTLISSTRSTINANLGKIPPSAIDLEDVVLGALILEASTHDTFRFLKPEHFYQEQHKLIYQSIMDLVKQNEPIDMRSVVIQLRKNGNLEIAGGSHKIAELTSKVSSSAHVEYHARIIIEFAIKRKLIAMSSEILIEAYDDQSDCFELMDKAETQLNEISEWRKK